MDSEIKEIFSDGSTSYYYSSLFFPSEVREDVFKLYAYVRTADDYVDDLPQDERGFNNFRRETFDNWKGSSDDKVVDLFMDVCREHDIEKEWVDAFLNSMEMDMHKSHYQTMEETLDYIHGSAEVIGLMMANILELGKESHHAAKMMGRSMQYANFIRDVKEDNELGRQYLPQEELDKHGLESLERSSIDEDAFKDFMRDQINNYNGWRLAGEQGFKYIPYRTRVPVKLSSNLYNWTTNVIEEDPMVVYDRKVRPSKRRITWEFARAFIP